MMVGNQRGNCEPDILLIYIDYRSSSHPPAWLWCHRGRVWCSRATTCLLPLVPLETPLRKLTRNMAKTREFGDLLNISGMINVRC